MLEDKIKQHIEEINSFVTDKKDELEQFRLKFLSKKGVVQGLFAEFKTVSPESRREVGQLMNELKTKAREKLASLEESLLQTRGFYGNGFQASFIDCWKPDFRNFFKNRICSF